MPFVALGDRQKHFKCFVVTRRSIVNLPVLAISEIRQTTNVVANCENIATTAAVDSTVCHTCSHLQPSQRLLVVLCARASGVTGVAAVAVDRLRDVAWYSCGRFECLPHALALALRPPLVEGAKGSRGVAVVAADRPRAVSLHSVNRHRRWRRLPEMSDTTVDNGARNIRNHEGRSLCVD